MLSYRYANPETARYELIMGVSGLIKASRCLIEPPQDDRNDYLGIMDELARYGEEAYRELVRGPRASSTTSTRHAPRTPSRS